MNLQDLFTRLQASAAALSSRQLATLALAFVAVVGVTIGSAYWLNTPSYDVLFSDLDAESAGLIVTRLKAGKIEYVLDDGGRTVKVPASRIDELRLDIASQGMPGTGRVGFEIFDRTSFGVTDFMEHVNYRRALEGELARTIASIAEVSSARVHIAMPQPSLFVGQERPTTASVVLKLRQNRQLAAPTVRAISSLVAGSVESLQPESVVVIDNFGRPLSRPAAGAGDEMDGGEQIERQQRIEREMSARLVSLLEPIVGSGRLHVNVTAKLNADSQEETEERWDPTSIVRSRQTSSQSTTTVPGALLPLAGARANLPPDAQTPPPAATPPPAGGANSMAEMTNYEVSKVTRHRVQPQGQIARLSVAVVLDDDRTAPPAGESGPGKATPRRPEEIQKIHDLVAAAVGLDSTRGDQLTVENIAFEEAPIEEIAPVPVWMRYQPQAFEAVRIIGVVLIGVFALFGVIRPMVRGSLGATPGLISARSAVAIQPRTVQDMENEIDAELQVAAGQTSRRLPVLTRRAATLTEKEPENTARLLRAWLSEEER